MDTPRSSPRRVTAVRGNTASRRGCMVRGAFASGYLHVFAGLAITAAGCIAPNLPSQRFHDPHDRGGLLGDYRGPRGGSHHPLAHSTALHPLDDAVAAETSCDCQQEGCPGGCGGSSRPPEIPWPRYHPVPTRPVFSGPLFSAAAFSEPGPP